MSMTLDRKQDDPWRDDRSTALLALPERGSQRRVGLLLMLISSVVSVQGLWWVGRLVAGQLW